MVMAIIAGGVFATIGPRLSAAAHRRLGSALAHTAAIPVDGVAIPVGLGLLVLLHRHAGTRLRHIWSLTRYPPLPVAVIASLPIASGISRYVHLPGAPGFTLAEMGTLASAYAALWLVQTAIEHCLENSSRPVVAPVDGLNTDERLREWLAREEPVSDQDSDLFGHSYLAARLVDRLADGDTTIALQGEFGSGKSTVCRLVATITAQRGLDLIPVFVSCWGFENAGRAQQDVLAGIVREVNREADCLPLRRLPADYVDAVSADVGWFKSLLRCGVPELTPVEQLRRLSPILAAIRRRVVVVIEDLDRAGGGFDVSLIQSLLMQFREVPRLSFILAISPGQRIDFAKLCDHLETMPMLERGQILRLLDRTRELLLREHRPGILLNKLDPLAVGATDERIFGSHVEYYWPWQLSLCGLLDRPRTLKHALRRVADAWPRIKGEVHFDHLLSIAALRVGAPEAFQFFVERHTLFPAAAKSPNDQLAPDARVDWRGDLNKEWLEIVRQGRFDARCAAGLMRDILPASGAVTGRQFAYTNIPQSMQSDRRRLIYARRLFTERCEPEETSDQRMLDLLRRADAEVEARAELAEAITYSESASLAFEDFCSHAGFRGHLELLTEVYAVMRREPHAVADRNDTPGFFAPWRRLEGNRPTNFETWIIPELVKCVPGQIRLLTDIYYVWLGTDRHSRAEREAARAAVLSALKNSWSEIAPSGIADGFSPRFAYTLFHLVFTTDYQRPAEVPHGTAADWSWSAKALLNACTAKPEVMIPQVLIALKKPTSGPELANFEIDEAKLDGWFGADALAMLKTVAATTVPTGFSEQDKYVIGRGIEEASKLSAIRRAGSRTPIRV